jgi:hypothetical protein
MIHYFNEVKADNVFIIASDFKNIAIFKPRAWRDGLTRYPSIVWYSETGEKLLRVTGNVHKYECIVTNNKFQYIVR